MAENTEKNELQLQAGPYRTTFVGTEITRASTKEEWANYGQILKRVEEAKQWAIGDWLLDGKSHYRDNVYKQAEELIGYGYQTLAKAKRMSEFFKFNWRHLNLSYEHHVSVSSIKQPELVQDKELKQGRMQWSKKPDMDKMQELLKQADNKEWSISELQKQVKKYKNDKEREFALHNSPEKYDVIYADPPWEYGDKLIEGYGAAEHHYPSMSTQSLCELSISKIASDNAVLFLWATSPLLEECFDVIKAWGFKYKTSFVWDKEDHNYGHYNSVRHEFLLICTRGTYLPENERLFDSVQNIKRSEIHSEKPEKFRDIIEEMYPSGRKIELFARQKSEGWDVWGNEL